ncbi:hypothetical protein CASFOL_021766 [Castilleja foliolosa]|uniref:Uncharacterized protein n=1 Tax=Castilleja foliolosa TaxID=1961234 RepID=A0ABD3D1N4_9LAMI
MPNNSFNTNTNQNIMATLQMIHFIIFLTLNLVLIVASISSSSSPPFSIAKPGCDDRCGDVSIPFPFGMPSTTRSCYLNDLFLINCDHSLTPNKPFIFNSDTEITDISLDGQLTILNYVAKDCCYPNGTKGSYQYSGLRLPGEFFTINSIVNKFTIIGCDTFCYASGQRLNKNNTPLAWGMAFCDGEDDLEEGSCTGTGCYQVPIPKDIWNVSLTLNSVYNYTYISGLNNCSYAFVAEEKAFTFSRDYLTNLRGSVPIKMPVVIDWSFGNGTNCEMAQMINPSSYACKGANVVCKNKPSNGYGYRCSCKEGYQGNPYLDEGCHDINECLDEKLNDCGKDNCYNNETGGYYCKCPKGYRGDGKKEGKGKGCVPGEPFAYKLAAGLALGVIVLLLSACWLYLIHKRRRMIKMRQKFFIQNGGMLLQEQHIRRSDGSSLDTTRIFSESELQKATDNFNNNMIIGQGGFGTVYKGLLTDKRIVAIKKSKAVDPKQIDQFINEVKVLSKISHRNVVKLLGCCLETQVPLLVYEFVSNGTLFEHVHNKAKARSLSWDLRLKLATETASVLSYLHSYASTPIIHRDVKTANILLDHTFTAKVSDFGGSKLVPSDQTQLCTIVQGTLGYLDPEYMQTTQLTEKSDVYSFGVVLVELLLGRKALSYDTLEGQKSLAQIFLSAMKQNQLFQVLDDNVAREGYKERVMKVAELAKNCLNVKGDDRPSMKEVAIELDSLRVGVEHSWVQSENNAENTKFMLDDGITNSSASGFSIGFDSARDQITLPVHGGR